MCVMNEMTEYLSNYRGAWEQDPEYFNHVLPNAQGEPTIINSGEGVWKTAEEVREEEERYAPPPTPPTPPPVHRETIIREKPQVVVVREEGSQVWKAAVVACLLVLCGVALWRWTKDASAST